MADKNLYRQIWLLQFRERQLKKKYLKNKLFEIHLYIKIILLFMNFFFVLAGLTKVQEYGKLIKKKNKYKQN